MAAKVACDGLIDTGATNLVVNADILDQAGVQEYAPSIAHGLGGEETIQVARVALTIFDSVDNIRRGFTSIPAIRPNKQLSSAQQCLIGRSDLSKFEFIYNGVDGAFKLTLK